MKTYKILVKEFLAGYVYALRKSRRLTQEEMAEQLRITNRAYGDLERGRYCFSSIALIFLILMLEENELRELLCALRKRIYQLEHENDELFLFSLSELTIR
ncbi:MAG: helix-turn-helix domain-containing protein [Candidatus Heteroscillospira sp.]|jgi:transcriptional regulator with XRE-family HTH domain